MLKREWRDQTRKARDIRMGVPDLDLVSDPGCQLTERGQFLGLDEAVLRGPQILERGFNVSE